MFFFLNENELLRRYKTNERISQRTLIFSWNKTVIIEITTPTGTNHKNTFKSYVLNSLNMFSSHVIFLGYTPGTIHNLIGYKQTKHMVILVLWKLQLFKFPLLHIVSKESLFSIHNQKSFKTFTKSSISHDRHEKDKNRNFNFSCHHLLPLLHNSHRRRFSRHLPFVHRIVLGVKDSRNKKRSGLV